MDGISYGPEGPRALNSWSSHKKELGSFRRMNAVGVNASLCFRALQASHIHSAPEEVRWFRWLVSLVTWSSFSLSSASHALNLPRSGLSCIQNPEYTGARRYGWSGAAGYQEALLPFHYLLNWLYKSIPHQTTELVSFPFSPNITFSSCPNSNNETVRKKITSTFGDQFPILQTSIQASIFTHRDFSARIAFSYTGNQTSVYSFRLQSLINYCI